MTAQQAQSEINKCEQDITCAHFSLCGAARNVAARAKECADESKTEKTLLPLLISLIGIFFFTFAWFLAIVMIIAGIVVAFDKNDKANAVVKRLESAQKQLYNTIDKNSKI